MSRNASLSSPTGPSTHLDSLSDENLRSLHRSAMDDPSAIQALLERARREEVRLENGVDRRSRPRTALIRRVTKAGLQLEIENIEIESQLQIYLHFDLGRSRYFFAVPPLKEERKNGLTVELPRVIYEAERRELARVPASDGDDAPRVQLMSGARRIEARLRDSSYHGMAVSLPSRAAESLTGTVRVRRLDAAPDEMPRFGSIRYRGPDSERVGWTQLGLETSAVEPGPPFPVEHRSTILEGGVARRAWRRVALAGAVAKGGSPLSRPGALAPIEVAEFENQLGQPIRGILDRACEGKGGTAVVIPPAWGRTKESFVALARTLTATFASCGEPVTVLRFDGTNRRGESYIDPECRDPGNEYLHFRFSQAVEDVRSSVRYMREDPSIAPSRVVLVSFSLGAVEARRALVEEAGNVDGWVSVVGMVDLQSGLRTVSGGVDYAYGQTRGVRFGKHELVGVIADMDLTGRDAFEHRLVLLEDAKRDMATLGLPVTWIHGKHDAWMDVDRVRSLLSAGPSAHRKLLEIPAGHQMRSSREALETFQLVSQEVLAMACGVDVEPSLPDIASLELQTRAERARVGTRDFDRKTFWADYLLGRDRRLGYELMSAASPYRALMRRQIDFLELEPGARVVDLGSGTGDFPVMLSQCHSPADVSVLAVDLVSDALERGRVRLDAVSNDSALDVTRLAADLNHTLPLAGKSVDAVLASLVLSYVDDPRGLLSSAFRVLRPGGVLVLSSMRRDADISKIYVESIAEFPPDRREANFGSASAGDFERLQRVFLNDAAKLVQLEEDGKFRFWDLDELQELVAEMGFEVEAQARAFGDPPQAVIVKARRPR